MLAPHCTPVVGVMVMISFTFNVGRITQRTAYANLRRQYALYSVGGGILSVCLASVVVVRAFGGVLALTVIHHIRDIVAHDFA